MKDERVRAAIANWAPRFVSQGVDFNDFVRVTERVETWPQWLPAWVENGDLHAALAREAGARGRTLTAGQAWNRAALSYHFAKFVWMVDMDLYRAAADKALAALAGVSLGGYYAPRAAAFEPRVKAVAGVSGAFNFGEVWDARPSLTKETFQHHSGAANPEEAREKAFELSLEGVAERIEQPLLVVTGKLDRLVGWQESKKIADQAPSATWVRFEEGNHVCNNIPYKYRPLVADWL